MLRLEPRHALIRALRNKHSETELTQALAAVLAADPKMASQFVRLALEAAPRASRLELRDLPAELECRAEEAVAEGITDLSFYDSDGRWRCIAELKIHAGYGDEQIPRYLRSLDGWERAALVALTRTVPTYGDDPEDDPRWAGSVRWGLVLPGLRQLTPQDPYLAAQWPLFLDVLEAEGSMGFTEADDELFQVWATFVEARQHLIDFVDSLRLPMLDELRDLLAPAGDAASRDQAAAFNTYGKSRRAVWARLAKIVIEFRIPADGATRIWAGVWGYGEPRFMVELPYPFEAPDAVEALRRAGFESWRDRWLTKYLPLTPELLAEPNLQERVVAFAAQAFREVVDSSALAAPASTPASTEDEEAEATAS